MNPQHPIKFFSMLSSSKEGLCPLYDSYEVHSFNHTLNRSKIIWAW